MKDPFKTPPMVRPFDRRGEDAMRALLGPGLAQDTIICITTPARWPRSIDDARADVSCRACGEPVWISPSSRASLAAGAVPVCVECMRKAFTMGRA